ncbi:DNA/RNA helicase domain-containing protein [Spirochaeta cellobiosiphila]|uniref:DNA/RNA helicase domain-containing protein n=1 Tax=Spirochaeta cellobiosiphila TaxID=504483 RepID=UPI00146D4A82
MAYVGETTSAVKRMKDHLDNSKRDIFKTIYLIEDETFNKSATLDIESKLIEYISADGHYSLQNNNRGLRNHNYYNKDKYKILFNDIWDELKALEVVSHTIPEIENSDLFKFSPYKTLTEDQFEIVENLDSIFKSKSESTSIINGEPGSGKTILAIYLAKYIASDEAYNSFKIGVIFPQTSLRKTVRRIFKHIHGLKVNMVMGPYDILKKQEKYDLLIVDEAHRLTQRRNLANYKTFDDACNKLGIDPQNSSQLDWIINRGKHVVLLHDPNQSVKPSDADLAVFTNLRESSNLFSLKSQQRVLAGDKYPAYIERILKKQQDSYLDFDNYKFCLFDNIDEMVKKIRTLNRQFGLCRIVAGYAWDWISKDDPNLYDIEIESTKLRWNATTEDWINTPNSINEIGCIHTVQGYDLNYCGVIIGPELIFRNGKILFVPENYKDKYGKHSSQSIEQVQAYIINIYKTLLTRGIKGTFIYACDSKLTSYLSHFISKEGSRQMAAEPKIKYGRENK